MDAAATGYVRSVVVTTRAVPAATLLGVAAGVLGLRGWRNTLTRLVDEHARYWRRRAEAPGERLYVALGDSLAQGISARRPYQGYVGQLAAHLERRGRDGRPGRVAVVNLSVSGATVADLLADQLPRLAELPEPELITVCIGTNDIGRTPPHRFRAAFTELCRRLPEGALVADVPAVPIGPDTEAAEELSRVCREVLAGFPDLVPVRLHRATRRLRPWHQGRDLVHPGARGHRRYSAAFTSALRTSGQTSGPAAARPARTVHPISGS